MMHVILTSTPDADLASKWNAFVANAQFATHYVAPQYFADPYVRGERFAVLALDVDGQICGVITGICNAGKVISGLYSRPQMVFRNSCDREATVATLLKGLNDLCDRRQSVELYAWTETPEIAKHGLKMRCSVEENSVVMIDLSKGAEAIFADFSQTRRNEIRKAIKQGQLEIKEVDTESELTELYEIQCDWNARKGNPVDSLARMRKAAEQRENRRIFIAKTENKVIAGSFYRFATGGVVEYAANFSIPEYQKLRPNDLIGWHAIQWACNEGLSHFSLGGSHLFLRRFGGQVHKTYRYRQERRAFGFRSLREKTYEFGLETYKRIPANVRTEVRKMLTW